MGEDLTITAREERSGGRGRTGAPQQCVCWWGPVAGLGWPLPGTSQTMECNTHELRAPNQAETCTFDAKADIDRYRNHCTLPGVRSLIAHVGPVPRFCVKQPLQRPILHPPPHVCPSASPSAPFIPAALCG